MWILSAESDEKPFPQNLHLCLLFASSSSASSPLDRNELLAIVSWSACSVCICSRSSGLAAVAVALALGSSMSPVRRRARRAGRWLALSGKWAADWRVALAERLSPSALVSLIVVDGV
jgi:hypothetical protein